jgi:hypothetical protein
MTAEVPLKHTGHLNALPQYLSSLVTTRCNRQQQRAHLLTAVTFI